MIECGSLEFADARVHARHGQRLDEPTWRRIETMREFAPMLELARRTALRPWLVGVTADSSVHQIEATLRGHWQALVDEAAAWTAAPWQPAVVWCAVLPDLGPLQHLARHGEPVAWMRREAAWRELCAAPAAARAALLGAGPLAPLARAWSEPASIGQAWLAEWTRRLPLPIDRAGVALGQLVRVLLAHGRAFGDAAPGQGGLLRGALRARMAVLLRRAALEPAAVFVHIVLCALDLERLRGELLRRSAFARWRVH